LTTAIRVWAPRAQHVDLVTANGRDRLEAEGSTGWWRGPTLPAGTDYAFSVDDREPRPDPRSPWQPNGVHGPSRTVDHDAFAWTDKSWHGRPLPGGVVYELHIGTFTPGGTFDSAIERLDHLVDLGVDFVEVMPVNAFPGRWGWGYDGVALFAVHESYGGPDALKRFVDACHARNLGAILDVVYNHLGPDGNYLPEFGPYFTDKHETPWGQAVNLDDDDAAEVRAFFVDNALQWLRDYHFDGLRLDAVHAFVDESPSHFLAELGDAARKLADEVGKPLFLIAESDLNDPRIIRPRADGGYGMDAQWSDDFHHALHSVVTGERDGYYADFGSLADIATVLTTGFVYTGQHSAYRGKAHGAPLPPSTTGSQLLGYLQNHDQIGNRARGDRVSMLTSIERAKIGAALVLTAPFTPMLFMGEEWGATTPWQYFTDHQNDELANAVREGRRAEFAAFGWGPDDVPDPQDPGTFERSRLNWAELHDAAHADLFDWYRALIRLRKQWSDLTAGELANVQVQYDEDAQWLVIWRGRIGVISNLSDNAQHVPLGKKMASVPKLLLASNTDVVMSDTSVVLGAHSVAIALG
jgi:maltooligosyltrehalose trehalohydrolase